MLLSNGGFSSNPENFTQVGEAVFFTATTNGFGTELWVTYGTSFSTRMVADINPGTVSSNPFNLVAYEDRLVFAARDSSNNYEPWISDGTEAGTFRIKDINPLGSSMLSLELNPYSYAPGSQVFTPFNGDLYFSAYERDHGLELWKTDGTESGTVLVADINPGAVGSYAGGFTFESEYGLPALFNGGFVESGGNLFFGANTATEGFELWKTDGTQSGTQLVKDILPGNQIAGLFTQYADIWGLTDVDGTLFFAAYDEEQEHELWKSDGTEAGTVLVKDINPRGNSYPFQLSAVNDELLFFAYGGDDYFNFDLWKSDGIEEGTVLVKDFPSASYYTYPPLPGQVAVSEGKLFFTIDGGGPGAELWKSDGTESGTVLVSDIRPGGQGSFPYSLIPVDGGVVFSADDAVNGRELWVSNGIQDGTQLLADLRPGSGSSNPLDLIFAGTKVYFSADDGTNGRQPWVIDLMISPANPGGPYITEQGAPIVLSGEESTGEITLYEWDLDNDGLFDDATGVNATFDTVEAGTFTVRLRLNGEGGPSAATTVTVLPESASIGGPYFGESGTLISLDATGSVGGLFEWDLDDDGLFDDATGLNADFNATADGVFDISLRVNGPGGPVASTTVIVESAIAELGGPYTVSQHLPLTLTTLGSAGTLFEWDLDNDGQFDDAVGETVDFDTSVAGEFNVAVRVNGPTGPIDATMVTVTPAIADVGGPYSVAQNIPFTLTAFAGGGELFEWDLDSDGQFDDAIGTSVNIDTSQIGRFYVRLRVNGDSGPIDSTYVDVVRPSADHGGPYAGFAGTQIPLNVTNSTAILHEWDLDDDGEFDDAVGENVFFDATESGLFYVSLRLNGPGGRVYTTSVTVQEATVDAGGPYAGNQYTPILLTGSSNMSGLFEWDLDDDGQYDDGVGESIFFPADSLGVFNVGLRVTGPVTRTSTTTVLVNPATIDTGGPYFGVVGTMIPLTATSTINGPFEWDLDNDGQYDDAVGSSVNFEPTSTGVFTIGVRVNGPGGLIDSTSVTVSSSIAPTATITGPAHSYYRGESVSFTLEASDPSAAASPGVFTFEIDWDGDFQIDETIANVPSGTALRHVFTSPYTGSIHVRATDSDNETGTFSSTPVIADTFVYRDNGQGKLDLIWGGTPGLDVVYVSGTSTTLSLYVLIENTTPALRLHSLGTITGKVILYGFDSLDVLAGEFLRWNAMEIHGGEGDDVIVGGAMGDLLYGGPGNDTIIGGTQSVDGHDLLSGGEGRDTLFGHLGADFLHGGRGEDLLISDRFVFSDVAAGVLRISNEWKSDRSYAERMNNILGITSTGLNGSWILSPGNTIIDDGEVDFLFGDVGTDWFFFNFDEDLRGDTIEIDEEETDSDP